MSVNVAVILKESASEWPDKAALEKEVLLARSRGGQY